MNTDTILHLAICIYIYIYFFVGGKVFVPDIRVVHVRDLNFVLRSTETVNSGRPT